MTITASHPSARHIIIDPSPTETGQVRTAPAPDGERFSLVRALLSAVGLILFCVIAVIFTFFWTIVRVIAHTLGRGRTQRREMGRR